MHDGGNQVYQECAPVWDGEDDRFDITSLDDLSLVPSLRRVLGPEFPPPEPAGVLESRGITADQPPNRRRSPRRDARHAPPSSRLRSSREVPPSPHRPKAQVHPVRGLPGRHAESTRTGRRSATGKRCLPGY
ncbi:hypothetical protein GCM10027162_07510 [Streptomyces incanus]